MRRTRSSHSSMGAACVQVGVPCTGGVESGDTKGLDGPTLTIPHPHLHQGQVGRAPHA